ncbi:MAG TPA: nucleotide-binding protein [Candidatus Glassbacteria bacterium]|nr:nucleotide-binding protein [Candidatus Glassbacteria bacterium]
MPYHVRITAKSDRTHDEVKIDLTEEQLRKQFLHPYETGKPIVVSGHTIPCDDIERISISYTEEKSDQLIPIIKAERRRNQFVAISISDEWYVADRGNDVTDDFITGPPGQGREEPVNKQWTRSQDVFVIHGRNTSLRDSMFDFLRAIGLRPIEWIEAVNATGSASPYVGEVLDVAFDRAQATIVLLTPDDEAKLRKEFIDPNDPIYEKKLTPQARPNVLFEAGMAIGRTPNRTIIVEVGDLRPFSDIAGRHTVRLDNSYEKRHELALKLRTAGCDINLSGTTDWHNVGDFSI